MTLPWATTVTLLRQSRFAVLKIQLSEHLKLLRENDTNCIYFYVKVLAFQGFWSLEPTPNWASYREHLIYYVRYWNSRLLIAFSAYLTLVTCPMSAWTNMDDVLIAVIEPLGFLFVTCMVGVGAASLIFKTKRFEEAIRAMEKMNRLGSLQAERPQEVLDYTHAMSKRTLTYFISVVVVVVAVCIGQFPEMYQKRLLFFKAWHPYNSLDTPYFQITLLGMTANALSGYTLIACLNALIMAMFGQAIGQFKLLNHNLRHITRIAQERQAAKIELAKRVKNRLWNTIHQRKGATKKNQNPVVKNDIKAEDTRKKRPDDKTLDEQMNHLMRRCVRHHQTIISFVEAFVAAFDLILAQQYNLCLAPAILGVTIITFSQERDVKTVVFVLLVLCSLIDLAIFCWLAEQVVDQNDQVREAVFACDWSEASEGFKQRMRIMMSCSNRPLTVRLLGFIPLNMEKFTQVLKMAYSYYMSIVASYERRLREARFLEAFNFGQQD